MSSKSFSVVGTLKRRFTTTIEKVREEGSWKEYCNSTGKDSMESLEEYLQETIAEFDKQNPGPLYPLSEYGNTCWLLGCEEMHIECPDKTHYIVMHCNCDPHDPETSHRHVYCLPDVIEPRTRKTLWIRSHRAMSIIKMVRRMAEANSRWKQESLLASPSQFSRASKEEESNSEIQVEYVAPPITSKFSWSSRSYFVNQVDYPMER